MFDPTPLLPNDTLTILVRFPTRIRNALQHAGLKTIGEVREAKDVDLLCIPDLGRESVRYLRRVIGTGRRHKMDEGIMTRRDDNC